MAVECPGSSHSSTAMKLSGALHRGEEPVSQAALLAAGVVLHLPDMRPADRASPRRTSPDEVKDPCQGIPALVHSENPTVFDGPSKTVAKVTVRLTALSPPVA